MKQLFARAILLFVVAWLGLCASAFAAEPTSDLASRPTVMARHDAR